MVSKIIAFFCQVGTAGKDALAEISVHRNICQNRPFGNHPVMRTPETCAFDFQDHPDLLLRCLEARDSKHGSRDSKSLAHRSARSETYLRSEKLRKSLMSVIFLPVILRLETAAPIFGPRLAFFGPFCWKSPMPIKFLVLGGGGGAVLGFLEGGGVKVPILFLPILFLWAWGFFREKTGKP